MLSTTGPQIAVAWCRRALGAAAAAAALSLAVPQAAQAIVKGFEPMEGIKGKGLRQGAAKVSWQCIIRCRLQLWLSEMADIIPAGTGTNSLHCRYSDYTRTESGLQFQDLRPGTGKAATSGSQVTVDWDGYTIGMQA